MTGGKFKGSRRCKRGPEKKAGKGQSREVARWCREPASFDNRGDGEANLSFPKNSSEGKGRPNVRRRREREGPGTSAAKGRATFGITVSAHRRMLFASMEDQTENNGYAARRVYLRRSSGRSVQSSIMVRTAKGIARILVRQRSDLVHNC